MWPLLGGQVLDCISSVTSRGTGDTAEDATQEALLAAATSWQNEGRPDNPLAWLITVASRRLTDLCAASKRGSVGRKLSPVGPYQWSK